VKGIDCIEMMIVSRRRKVGKGEKLGSRREIFLEIHDHLLIHLTLRLTIALRRLLPDAAPGLSFFDNQTS